MREERKSGCWQRKELAGGGGGGGGGRFPLPRTCVRGRTRVRAFAQPRGAQPRARTCARARVCVCVYVRVRLYPWALRALPSSRGGGSETRMLPRPRISPVRVNLPAKQDVGACRYVIYNVG
jgi:hypothetical protein